MNEFIESLNVTNISNSDAKLDGLSCESSNAHCDCHCPDGCDGTDDDA